MWNATTLTFPAPSPISMASSPTGAAKAESSGEIVPDVVDVEHAAAGTGGGSPGVVTLFSYADSALRLLLFVTSLAALLVLVTSTQTEQVPVLITAFSSPFFVTRTAEFQHSPALRYLLAALAVTCFYSVFTLLSVHATRSSPPARNLSFHLVLFDALMAGVLASATGAGGAIAYIGLKGDDHAGWNQICNIYDTFCRHIAGAVAGSLFGSVVLVALVGLSAYSVYRCSR